MKFGSGCLSALLLAPCLHAALIHVWGIREIENSPALVVATVENVAKGGPAPPGRSPSRVPERYWQATLRVRRSYPENAFPKVAIITLRYISYDDISRGGMMGNPLPHLEKGLTALFPLAPGDDGRWRLVADVGRNLTVPAIIRAPQPSEKPHNGRSFILSELAGTLANGATADRYDAAVYLREASAWPEGFREALQQAMGTDDDRWLEVSCAVLASLGIPHPTVHEFLTTPNLPGAMTPDIGWLLAKGTTRDYPTRLIQGMLRNMPAYDWGAANMLLEFKDSLLVVQGMTASLERDPGGSIYVAWTLARNGQRAFLPQALDAAVKLVIHPESVAMNRLQASSWLLRDYGSDRQFAAIPATLRRLKSGNEDAYRRLFGSVNYRENKRELQAAEILLDDRRPGYGSLRYCDVAAATVEALSGETFGIRRDMASMTLEERDRAVARAADWLGNHRGK